MALIGLPNSEESLEEGYYLGAAYGSCLGLDQQDDNGTVQSITSSFCCRLKIKLGQGRAWVGLVEKAEPSPHSPSLRESQQSLWPMGWSSFQGTEA